MSTPICHSTGERVLACHAHVADALRAVDALRPWVDRVRGRRAWRPYCHYPACVLPAEWALGDSWEAIEALLEPPRLRLSDRYRHSAARVQP